MQSVKTTARLTGLAYLGMAVGGIVGYIVIRARVYGTNEGAELADAIIANESLARVGIAFELLIVVSQAATALLFYLLFRSVNRFAAGSIVVLGMVNATAVMIAAGALFSAVQLATDGAADQNVVTALVDLSGSIWTVAQVFFGLWLLPMGWLAWKSGYMPAPLGWLLLAGGVGYVISALLSPLIPDSIWHQVLTAPSFSELIMMFYLLVVGVRPGAVDAGS